MKNIILIGLILASIICVIPMPVVLGQEAATVNELTVTSIALRDLSNFSNSKITGKDGEKEICIENLRNAFDADISVQSVDIDINENGIREQGGSNVLNAYIEHGSKPFIIKFEVGMKLKYKLIDKKPVILFDELYCMPNQIKTVAPTDFDTSQYADITLNELDAWEKTNSGESKKYKASVYHCQVDAMVRMMLNAANDYFFSDMPGKGVDVVQFKSNSKWPAMKDEQKVVIYFNAMSKGKGSESFKGRIIDNIELSE